MFAWIGMPAGMSSSAAQEDGIARWHCSTVTRGRCSQRVFSRVASSSPHLPPPPPPPPRGGGGGGGGGRAGAPARGSGGGAHDGLGPVCPVAKVDCEAMGLSRPGTHEKLQTWVTTATWRYRYLGTSVQGRGRLGCRGIGSMSRRSPGC